MKKLKTLLAVVLAVFCFNTDAQILNPNAGCIVDTNGDCVPNTILSAVPFLRIIPDARSGAMGDVGIATSPDPNALHFNASKLAFVEKDVSFSATYTPWLRELGLTDVYLAYLAGYKQIDELQAVGFGLRYFSLGDISFTDFNGNPLGNGRPRELEVSFAYARKLSSNFSSGITGKYILSNLASGLSVGGTEIFSANSFAADISFTYKGEIGNNDLTIGSAISNLGSKVSYSNSVYRDFLPANLGLGATYSMNLDEFNSLSFSLDINKLLVPTPIPPKIENGTGSGGANPEYDNENGDGTGDGIADFRQKGTFAGILGSFSDAPGGFSEELKELNYSFGIEYWYDKQFAVRAGYYYENFLKGDRKFLTVGVGLEYNVFGLNLSYLVPTNNRRNPLDNTLRFTFNFDFDAFQGGDF